MIDSNPVSAPRSNDVVFAADLGGTYLRSATVDGNGEIHFRLKQNTPHAEKPDEIVRALVLAANQCKEQGGAMGDRIRAVSVVVPGSVKVDQGLVVKAPNVPCLDGFRLTEALTSELKLPAVLENDANAAAVGEMWRGAAVAQWFALPWARVWAEALFWMGSCGAE